MTLSEQVWQERKEKFKDYIRDNPGCTRRDIVKKGHYSTLKKLYNENIGSVKKNILGDNVELKRKDVSKQEWEKRKESLKIYIRKNPDCTGKDIEKKGHRPALWRFYKNSPNSAKEDIFGDKAELREKASVSEQKWQERKEALDGYIIANPNCNIKDIKKQGHRPALRKFYNCRPNLAKQIILYGNSTTKKQSIESIIKEVCQE